MRNFVKRAIAKIDQLDTNQIIGVLQSLSGELQMVEDVLESIEDAVILTDDKLVIRYATSNVRTLIPMARMRTYEGTPLEEVLADEHVLSYIEAQVRAIDEDMENEFSFQKGTSIHTVSVTVTSYKEAVEGQGASFVIIVSDVTAHNEAERRLRRSENLASMTTMAAGVAHEIKNPLAAMDIHLQLLRKAFVSNQCLTIEDATRYLDVLEEEVGRLNTIVVDFLFAVRPLDSRLRLSQIRGTLEEVCSFAKVELAAQKIELKESFDSYLPRLNYDDHLVKQALLNLIKNAMAAMEGGGTLLISARQEGNHVIVSVKDTGVGIADDILLKLFEPYFTTKASGTGLGLTMVYKIMKEHNGEVTVQSKRGEGTTFNLHFPVPESEHLAIEQRSETEASYETHHPHL
ncbi:MAG: ATP-binding protein [Sphaerochaeta sp.]|jgi:two-component system, sporulation sensor kinase E|nr:histidine kinase [Spirochaetales bacterium]